MSLSYSDAVADTVERLKKRRLIATETAFKTGENGRLYVEQPFGKKGQNTT